MNRLRNLAFAGWVALVAGSALAAPQTMSVQVRAGQLRVTPSFLGKIVATLEYADKVTVAQKQGEWMQVTTPAGASGWIHQSALSSKRIELKAGSENVQTGASGEELALAGKGFNSDVEADFKKRNQNVDFTWIDRMEKIKIGPQEIIDFLNRGGLAQP
jgi:SH3-like domain-containing protein